MSGRNIAMAIFLAAVSVAGALYLLGVQFADGGAYPEYSSLRSDPLGAKLLYDTLALVPGASVARNYLPLDYVGGAGTTVLLLSLSPELFDQELLDSVDRLAARGNRVVLTIAEAKEAPKNSAPLAKTWKVKFGFDAKSPRDFRLYFREATGWKTISEEAAKSMAIERPAGKGSVVLFADSSDFANSTLADQDDADFAMISTAIGPAARVIFDEQHFGITQTGSVVGLVRRFRLTGMALGFAICAALFIWRNVTAFPPPEPATKKTGAAGRTSRSGLLTLLRRHIPASELATVCWNEWLATNRRGVSAENTARAQEIARREADPVKALREIQPIVHLNVHSKGNL
jgi:hypothetical protein